MLRHKYHGIRNVLWGFIYWLGVFILLFVGSCPGFFFSGGRDVAFVLF